MKRDIQLLGGPARGQEFAYLINPVAMRFKIFCQFEIRTGVGDCDGAAEIAKERDIGHDNFDIVGKRGGGERNAATLADTCDANV